MARLLIMDSGVGGLSIAQDIVSTMPCTSIDYVSDAAYFPYGGRTPDSLVSIVDTFATTALEHIQPDVIVLACNTASTLALKHLRTKTDIPIVGVVPAVKPAGLLTQTGVFGVLATPATIKSPYLENLMLSHCPNRTMIGHGSADLVVLAEAFLQGKITADELTPRLKQAIAPLFEKPESKYMDVLVLACTHFPILKQQIQQLIPELTTRAVQVIDSGEAVAKQVMRVSKDHLQPEHDAVPSIHIWQRSAEMKLVQDEYSDVYSEFLVGVKEVLV